MLLLLLLLFLTPLIELKIALLIRLFEKAVWVLLGKVKEREREYSSSLYDKIQVCVHQQQQLQQQQSA